MEDDYIDKRTDEEKVRSSLRLYVSMKAENDHYREHPYTEFDPQQFTSDEEFVAHQLWRLVETGLFDEMDPEFANKDELYEKAIAYLKRLNEAKVDARFEAELQNEKDAVISEVLKASPKLPAAGDGVSEVLPEQTSDLKLSDFLSKYIKDKMQDSAWADKTRRRTETHFNFLIDTVGDVRVQEVGKQTVDTFRDALRNKQHMKRGALKPLSVTSKNDYLETCKRVFEYCSERIDVAVKNPFEGKTIKFPNKKGDKRKRLPFSREQLLDLFSQPTHTAGKFRFAYEYWIPLLGLFTGARANELCQLHMDDVYEVDCDGEKVWCISINADTPDKSLKTGNAGIKPLHPKLIELGFGKFVELKRTRNYKCKDKKGYYRLFDGLTYTKAEGYRKNFSRWFNGTYADKQKGRLSFKQAVEVESCSKYLRDFHSFRHTCATALENAGVSNNISFRINRSCI